MVFRVLFSLVCSLGIITGNPGERNLALHKPARQGDTYIHMGVALDAGLAVDGSRKNSLSDSMLEFMSCTHTIVEPWWEVDLGESVWVSCITITNRDVQGHRLSGFTINIGDDYGGLENNPQCLFQSEAVAEGATVELECDQPIRGRYVSIKKLEDTEPLSLCEVEVHPTTALSLEWGQRLETALFVRKETLYTGHSESFTHLADSQECAYHCLERGCAAFWFLKGVCYFQ